MRITHLNNHCGIWYVRSGMVRFPPGGWGRGGGLNVSRNKAIIGGFRGQTVIPVIYLRQSEISGRIYLDSARGDRLKIAGPGLNRVGECCQGRSSE